MIVTYKKSLKKIFANYSSLVKAFGEDMAIIISKRLNELEASESLEFMAQVGLGGCHKLKGKLEGKYSIHLKEPHRLLVVKISSIKNYTVQIEAVVDDYH